MGRKRRENQQEIKTKKIAQMALADKMAKCIFKIQELDDCTACAELRNCLKGVKEEHEDVEQTMEAEREEMKDKVEHNAAALQAKKVVIRHLQVEQEVERV